MFKSLRIKMVLIFFVLVISVMAVIGTFLLNSITTFYFDEFNTQVESVFKPEVLKDIEKAFENDSPSDAKGILDAYSGLLGIDSGRSYYILDGTTSEVILSSQTDVLTHIEMTPNIVSSLAGEVGLTNLVSSDYLDLAIPVLDGDYIVYIKDDRTELDDLTWLLLSITIQAMLIGIVVSVILSIFLSKTMTNPIEKLITGAKKLATGNFDEKIAVESGDEIGNLTQTFNQMSNMLKDTLEKVEEEKNKLSTLFLHMTDGVLAFEPNGKIINMNIKAEQMLGVTYKEELWFSDIFKKIKLPKYENEKEKYAETEYSVQNKTYRVLFAPLIADKDGETGIIVVIYDITESKKLEDARREFVANVSHELRTPLTNIKSYTETILENKDYLDDETEDKFLGIISSETDRMTRIVRDLLTLSKLDHGKMDMNFKVLDVEKMLNNVYDTMVLEATNSNIKIEKKVQYNLRKILGDEDRMKQVMINIVSNAIKYTLPDKVVKIIAENEKEKVKIQIIDEGFGIPKEDLPRIFDRFYRVDKARSREKGGTGLGLAISKNIVEAHGGTIYIESVVEKGSVVTIYLPYTKDSSDE